MSDILQLLAHAAVLGASIRIAVPFLLDRPRPLLAFAMIAWIGFWAHLASAVWITSWGTGRDWIDRVGILVRGAGFALITAGSLATVPWLMITLSLLGGVLMIFGRALWELAWNRPAGDENSSTNKGRTLRREHRRSRR